MLTCSGCLVARFCSADHQKMAAKKAALGRNSTGISEKGRIRRESVDGAAQGYLRSVQQVASGRAA
jgi:hypothetical protein